MRRLAPIRKAMITAAAVLVAAGLMIAAGRPGVVRTKTGVVYDGIVEEREGSVLITVRGIDTNVPRDAIDTITYGDFETRWNDAYSKLKPDDAKTRVDMGRRAFDEHRYDLAEKALRDAQTIDPNNAQAGELLRMTISQRRMEHSQANPPPEGDRPAPGGIGGEVRSPSQYSTLTLEEVNRIKQTEMRDGDDKVRFRFDKGVLKRFWDTEPSLPDTYKSYAEFLKVPPAAQARMIVDKGGSDMAKDVKVTNDPAVFVEFKTNVLPLVLRGCATSACHGGNNDASKRFALIQPAPDPQSQYTNFYVLQDTKVNQNKGLADNVLSGGPTWAYMIDRTNPEQSLLLHYGLPDNQTDFRHPRVKGVNPLFRKNDKNYNAVLTFVRGLTPIQPEYGFDFELQRKGDGLGLPTSLPTTLPAAATQPVKDATDALKGMLGR